MQTTLIAPLTQNAKLGEGVATTYRPVGNAGKNNGTCPGICPHLPENGGKCYTKAFLVNRQQKMARERNDPLDRLLLKGAKFVRLHTSGDFFKRNPKAKGGYELDKKYLGEVVEWASNHLDITIWTYTHDVRKLIDSGFSYKEGKFSENLHIVASVETDEEMKLAKEYGFRTARVILKPEDKYDTETFCPYDLSLNNKEKPKTTCAKCTLCFNPKHKKDIAFLLH